MSRAGVIVILCSVAAGCGRVKAPGGGDGSEADAAPSVCTIEGETFADGDVDPDNPCGKCDVEASASAWSPNDGASCDDELYCTGADSCQGGTCSVHAGAPCLLCDEGGESCDRNPLVPIEAGTFTMGSPAEEVGRESNFVDETQHEVTLTRAFEMTTTEVTQGQFVGLLDYNPSQFNGCGVDCPVEGMNFFEALAYANLASEEQGLPPCYELGDIVCGDDSAGSAPSYCRDNGFISSATIELTAATPYDCTGFRLPTEAEWEWAARAGTTTVFSDGGTLDDAHIDCATPFHLTQIAWYCGNGDGVSHPVGLKDANPWGLHDVHGNVHEWTWDWYGDYPTAAVTDPTGPESGNQRTYRSGAWGDSARYSRSATRSQIEPVARYPGNLGFRLVRTAGASR